MKAIVFRLALIVTVVAGGCSQHASAPAGLSKASIIIKPGPGFGPIGSGTTMEQVIADLGLPDRTNHSVLEYQSLGFSVNPAPDGHLIHLVLCNKNFAGKTEEGIGIGSSRADVVHAYGKPTGSTEVDAHSVALRYRPRGLFFHLQDGEVDSIGVIIHPSRAATPNEDSGEDN